MLDGVAAVDTIQVCLPPEYHSRLRMVLDYLDIILVAEIGYVGYSAAYTENVGRAVADLRYWRWDT